MLPTRPIRHEVYDYLKQRGFELSKEDIAFVSAKMKQHDESRFENLTRRSKQFSIVEEKIGKYLKKARTLPQAPVLKAQVETLELVNDWLHEDPQTNR